jgi:hypothetical protein
MYSSADVLSNNLTENVLSWQAWCLNLEYSISGAAVAASWGSKVLNLCSDNVVSYMYPAMDAAGLYNVNVFAGKY